MSGCAHSRFFVVLAASYGFEDLEEVDDEEAVFELNDS